MSETTPRTAYADVMNAPVAGIDVKVFDPHPEAERIIGEVMANAERAYGMLTMALAGRVVTDWVGDPARVLGYFVRFTRPVVVPDTDEGVEVVYRATVADVADGVAKLSITAECGDDQVLGAARAEVRVD